MLVAFLHVGADASLPRLMVESGKKFGYQFLQMTDEDSPVIDGCAIRRIPWDKKRLMTYRMRHLAELNQPALIVDTDILFQKDVSDIWARDFDIALTWRPPGSVKGPRGEDLAKMMPYNTGVMFCKNPEFWIEAHKYCKRLNPGLQDWYGDQVSVRDVSKKFKLLEIPCEEWNYSPKSPEDKPANARILHYKGDRKAWMLSNTSTLSLKRQRGKEPEKSSPDSTT